MTDVPACGPCKDARIAYDEWRAPLESVKNCPEHGKYTAKRCNGCVADEKAISA